MKIRECRCLALFILLFSAPLLAYLKTTYMVPMRDGVKLATDVYLAEASAQKWPALLIRTPYGKTGFLTPTDTFDEWVKAGYALVVQDTRGRGDSQGLDSLFLDDGWGARHRYSLWRENFMTPDSIYPCEVDLWSTAIIFNQGHRIRAAIASSNAPRFDPNPNTGKPFRADNATVVATNTLHFDAARPSHLSLPVTISGGGLAVVDPNASTPRDFVLEQNYPNPVWQETQIAYALNRTTTVRLSIFNMLGQELRTLVDGLAPAGKYAIKWDGLDHHGQRAARGIYFYRFTAGNFVATRKLVVVQ